MKHHAHVGANGFPNCNTSLFLFLVYVHRTDYVFRLVKDPQSQRNIKTETIKHDWSVRNLTCKYFYLAGTRYCPSNVQYHKKR